MLSFQNEVTSQSLNKVSIEDIPDIPNKFMDERRNNPKSFCFYEIPSKIRELRGRIHYSQREVARLSGVAITTYRRIESGKKSPTLEQLEIIAKALKTSFGALTGLIAQPDFEHESYSCPDAYRCYLSNVIYYGAGRDGKIPKRKLIALLYWCELVWYFENACSGLTRERYYKTEFGPLAGDFFETCEALENEGKLARKYLGGTTFFYLVEGSAERGRLAQAEVEFIRRLAGFWRDRPTDELVRLIARQAAWRRADVEQEIDFHETFGDEPQRLYGTAISLVTTED